MSALITHGSHWLEVLIFAAATVLLVAFVRERRASAGGPKPGTPSCASDPAGE
jgi:hypothetical protein